MSKPGYCFRSLSQKVSRIRQICPLSVENHLPKRNRGNRDWTWESTRYIPEWRNGQGRHACVCVYTSRVQNKYFCSCGNGFSISLVYQINVVKLNYTRQRLEGFCIILRNKEKHNINLKNHAGKTDYGCLDCSEVCREQTF